MLFTSCPAYGHALPMLPLIRAAGRAGHDVRVATGPDLVAPLASRGLDVHAVGPTWESSWSAHEAVWADQSVSEEQRMMAGVVALFGAPALARFDDLVDLASEWRPDLVVHEVLEQAGSMLATRLGVPGVVHGIGPMFPFYAQLIGAAGAAIGRARAVAAALDRTGPGPLPALVAARRATALARRRRGAAQRRRTRSAATPSGRRLAAEQPVAYFTLGTVKNANTADFTTGLKALAAYDGVVVATTGRRLDPDELGAVPANALVEEFVPQADLLERADLLVSHSGSGTMLGGLVHGVPQVALPRGTDQPENAALLVRAGAGLLVAPEDYAIESIAAAVSEGHRRPGVPRIGRARARRDRRHARRRHRVGRSRDMTT